MLDDYVRSSFPQIKLFYEKISHKKVVSDYYVAIPYGKKCFAWFTHYNNENMCIFIEIKIEKNGLYKIINSYIKPVAFHESLSYGTLLFGTIIPKTRFFNVENIFMYKGRYVTSNTNNERLVLLENIFKTEIKQITLLQKEIIFGMAHISHSFKLLNNTILSLPYNIYSIQCKNFLNNNAHKLLYKPKLDSISSNSNSSNRNSNSNSNSNSSNRNSNNNSNSNRNSMSFDIMAMKGVDNYKLMDKHTGEFIQIAYIPNYQTSKLMNSIFRVIKENNNLDALEESDEEDDFENTDESKFVDLSKKVTVKCILHDTFKKWVPVKLLSN